ncbi:aquaporin-like protein [Ascodesmis nigricans]|uniref:Aquaporin-like protein n=1 Tax=Ascodesmis nigricans TaxID=341454 RepID=A0A4S2N358_9PEZI|nr:aquaporin-like protein [Ascodesmis nigricans]
MYLFFAFSGVEVAKSPTPTSNDPATQYLYIALCFGFSLAVNVWIFFRVSGGFFNPAVTFGFLVAGKLPPLKAAVHFFAQMLGGMAAAGLVKCLFPGNLDVGTKLSAGTSVAQGLFIEMFITAELVFTVFMLAAEKHKATFLAPIGIGLVFFVIELVSVYFTGGSANPARSFGPCIANRSFPGVHWIYWVGPGLGAILAAAVYKLVKMLEYEQANPGQDAAHVCTHGDKCPYDGANDHDDDHSIPERRPTDLEARAGACTMSGGVGRPECGLYPPSPPPAAAGARA